MHQAVALRSEQLRLYGVADSVEDTPGGVLVPVEHKSSGRQLAAARLQVCGQALCLAEMTGRPVPRAVVYVRSERIRHVFAVDGAARAEVMLAADRLRAMLTDLRLPPVHTSVAACRSCSVYSVCLPEARTRSA